MESNEPLSFREGLPEMTKNADNFAQLGLDGETAPTAEQLRHALRFASDELELDVLRGAIFDHWAVGILLHELGVEAVAGILQGSMSVAGVGVIEVPINGRN